MEKITMVKDGATKLVHEGVVKELERLGWQRKVKLIKRPKKRFWFWGKK